MYNAAHNQRFHPPKSTKLSILRDLPSATRSTQWNLGGIVFDDSNPSYCTSGNSVKRFHQERYSYSSCCFFDGTMKPINQETRASPCVPIFYHVLVRLSTLYACSYAFLLSNDDYCFLSTDQGVHLGFHCNGSWWWWIVVLGVWRWSRFSGCPHSPSAKN